jgi:hypothetical protein
VCPRAACAAGGDELLYKGLQFNMAQFRGMVNGLANVASPRSKQSDVICLVYGTQTAYVLRENPYRGPSDPEKTYELVGKCYLHGMMDGEALQVESHEGLFITIWIPCRQRKPHAEVRSICGQSRDHVRCLV